MKSKNNLTLTGVVVSDLQKVQEHRNAKFILAHYFGGGRPPLHLKCVIPDYHEECMIQKGKRVNVEAYIRPGREGVMAVIKKISVR